MKKLQSILQATIVLGFLGCQNSKVSELKKFKDVSRAVLRDDGLYNVICLDGSVETGISLQQLEEDDVCNESSPNDPRTQFVRACKLGQNAPEFKVLKLAAGESDCGRAHDVISKRGVLNIFAYPPASPDAITTIEPIKYFPDLKQLGVFAQKIEDLRPLSRLTKLEKLALTHCQIRDVSPLKNLERLEYLNLSYNQIKDFSAVENLSQLKELVKTGNP
jgi:hypothetical protein